MIVPYMQAITERYKAIGYIPYRWFQAGDAPSWTPLAKRLADSRIGVLSTSGTYVLGQVAYHYKDDTSIRSIPSSTDPNDLRFSHVTENYLVGARRDPECLLPLAALRRLVADGFIGSLADQVFSCMGGVYSQRRVREEIAPALLAGFREQKVDCALLIAM